jgi:hypothetical protein
VLSLWAVVFVVSVAVVVSSVAELSLPQPHNTVETTNTNTINAEKSFFIFLYLPVNFLN